MVQMLCFFAQVFVSLCGCFPDACDAWYRIGTGTDAVLLAAAVQQRG